MNIARVGFVRLTKIEGGTLYGKIEWEGGPIGGGFYVIPGWVFRPKGGRQIIEVLLSKTIQDAGGYGLQHGPEIKLLSVGTFKHGVIGEDFLLEVFQQDQLLRENAYKVPAVVEVPEKVEPYCTIKVGE